MKLTKKDKAIKEVIVPGTTYKATQAIEHLKNFASKKFVESFEVAINLGVDPRKSNEVVRGASNLPKGTGKTVRVAVFAQGDNVEKAKKAGADIVGFEDLADQIKNGEMDFDVVIATPDAMRVVGQLGQILGPRGLMPNPKVGTVTTNVEAAVTDAKAGQVRFRTDKNGIVHAAIGKIDFAPKDLLQNLETLLSDIKKLKPVSSKGIYIKKITFSTTMGPGLAIDLASVSM